MQLNASSDRNSQRSATHAVGQRHFNNIAVLDAKFAEMRGATRVRFDGDDLFGPTRKNFGEHAHVRSDVDCDLVRMQELRNQAEFTLEREKHGVHKQSVCVHNARRQRCLDCLPQRGRQGNPGHGARPSPAEW
jgi:hypothetical protein